MSAELPDDLFATGSRLAPRLELLGGKIPVILVDDVYVDPARVREHALALHFEPPPYSYPGRLATIPLPNASLATFLRNLLGLVNKQYLPRIPAIAAPGGVTIAAFGWILTDFGIIDLHPDQLTAVQRQPHTDPVPIFALIYLNEEERGGTLFFESDDPSRVSPDRSGYFGPGDDEFRLCGRIEGRYNRMAIYPGFVPHSGEIAGDWILSDDRVQRPRLTQRFLFFP